MFDLLALLDDGALSQERDISRDSRTRPTCLPRTPQRTGQRPLAIVDSFYLFKVRWNGRRCHGCGQVRTAGETIWWHVVSKRVLCPRCFRQK
jgi:hypothetical protein